jgi:hypothetical protein
MLLKSSMHKPNYANHQASLNVTAPNVIPIAFHIKRAQAISIIKAPFNDTSTTFNLNSSHLNHTQSNLMPIIQHHSTLKHPMSSQTHLISIMHKQSHSNHQAPLNVESTNLNLNSAHVNQ